MQDKFENVLLDEETAFAKKQGKFKYIISIILCVVPVLAYWAVSVALDLIMFALSAVGAFLVVLGLLCLIIGSAMLALGLSLGTPGANLISVLIAIFGGFIMFCALLSLALLVAVLVVYSVLSLVSFALEIVFPIIYILIMILPLVVSIKTGAFSLKKNKTALITAIVAALVYGIIAGLLSLAFGAITGHSLVMMLLKFLFNVETVGVFFSVLMTLKLIKIIRDNKAIDEARENFKIKIIQI